MGWPGCAGGLLATADGGSAGPRPGTERGELTATAFAARRGTTVARIVLGIPGFSRHGGSPGGFPEAVSSEAAEVGRGTGHPDTTVSRSPMGAGRR